MKKYIITCIILVIFISVIFSCKHKPPIVAPYSPDGNFPPEIAAIFLNKCATAGCHNQASGIFANNLMLDTWENLFKGGSNGAEIIPYQPEYSPLLYFVNTNPANGIVATPTMPYNSGAGPTLPPLSQDEYSILRDWIAKGAPDKNGKVAFSDNADTRQKIYITQQGCDLLAVIDAESKLVMRYIPIGGQASIESPHCVRVSNDGKYAYVSFTGSKYLQKIDTRTDKIVGTAIFPGTETSWNIIYISPGDTNILASNLYGYTIATMDTRTMQPDPDQQKLYSNSALFLYPHGIESSATFDTFYVTAQNGNTVYKFGPPHKPFYKKVSINGLPPGSSGNDSLNPASPNPHEILMVPDRSKYFLTCQTTNEVRVIDARTDAILKVIPVGAFPQEIAVSQTRPYMFVTCMEDTRNTLPGRKGSVYVINYNTYEVVKEIYGDFYQPHGITVDDRNGIIYIASTNASPDGPPPHHASSCDGKSGWYSIYDLKTLDTVNRRRYQLSIMPYSAATRFK